MFDKKDDVSFSIVAFPFLNGDVNKLLKNFDKFYLDTQTWSASLTYFKRKIIAYSFRLCCKPSPEIKIQSELTFQSFQLL